MFRRSKSKLLVSLAVIAVAGSLYLWTGTTLFRAKHQDAAEIVSPTAAPRAAADDLLAKGQRPQARKLLEDTLLQFPGDAPATRALAKLLWSDGETLEAQRLLEKNLALHPDDPATNESLADMVVQSVGQPAYPTVQKFYEVALKSEPQRASAAVSLAKIYLSQNRVEDAAKILEPAARANPGDAPVHLETARVLARMGRVDAASTFYDRATAIAPDAATYCEWGVMLIAGNKARRAETVIRQAIERDAASPIYHMQLGRALREQGELSAAMKEFVVALDKDKKYAPTYLEIAATRLSLKDEVAAEKFLRDALTVDRNYTQAKVALARLLITNSDPARRNLFGAADLLRQAIDETHGSDLTLLIAYADVLYHVDLPDQALEQIEKAIVQGSAHGLTPVQNELLLGYRQKYLLAILPPLESTNGSFLAVDGMPQDDPTDARWPEPKQPSVAEIFDKPLDVTRPPDRGTALDPDIHLRAQSRRDPSGIFK